MTSNKKYRIATDMGWQTLTDDFEPQPCSFDEAPGVEFFSHRAPSWNYKRPGADWRVTELSTGLFVSLPLCAGNRKDVIRSTKRRLRKLTRPMSELIEEAKQTPQWRRMNEKGEATTGDTL